MPQIIVNGNPKEFTFNNIVPCKTPGGTPFTTAIDICLDHTYGVAKSNFNNLSDKDPSILMQPVSHVVVSNCVHLDKKQIIGSNPMHVDPLNSPRECKKGITQKQGSLRKLAFGNDFFRVFDVVKEQLVQLVHNIKNKYAHKTLDPQSGRNHSYPASLNDTKFKKSEGTSEFQNLKNKYRTSKGDYLKTQILEDLKNRIQKTSTKEELDELKKEFKTSYENDILSTGQGMFTKKTGIKTSSIKALESMIEQQENHLSQTELKLPT